MNIPRRRRRQIVIFALIIAGFAFVDHLLNTIDIGKLLGDVSEKLGAWTYGIVGLAAFLETGAFVGLILPGESAVILGGAVAGQGATSIVVTIAVVWLCAWGGDTASFLLGRRLGRGFILEHGPKLQITHERFERVEAYFQRYGGRTILIGRFIGFVRAIAPFTAGSSGMRYRDFLPFSVLGTGLWSATFCLIGYYASKNIDRAAEIAGKSTFYFGVAVGVIVAVVVVYRYLREAENRKHAVAVMETHRLLRPLVLAGRRLEPQARFIGRRLTTGQLGLELTALLAVAAVGAFVVIAYAVTFGPDSASTGGDRVAFDVAADLRADWLTQVAKVLTWLGSAAVIIPVALVAAVVLGRGGRWAELAVMVAALVAVFIASDLIKAAVDRPRPAHPLVATDGSSFPSGHAAHAVLYPFLAILAVNLAPSLRARWRTAILVTGFLLAIIVGLTRVYLRAHYMSDVYGGWALGAAGFALAAAVAMVVVHLRENPSADDVVGDHPH
jgi:membrane protein DedA with SNARE-associated domain/membrane-associated phospholipid phosphatase